jgi:molybdenum cofactor guanylyltransferase
MPVYDRAMGNDADHVAFILAGGKSTRMGTDKAFVMLEGQTLLARALELARAVAGDVRIVGDVAKFAAFAPTVGDVFPGCGPLGGIHAALRASAAEWNLMLAVDTPFVSVQFLRYLVTRARGSNSRVTVPHWDGGWQPLCAVYRREFADIAEPALRAGRYKIDALFDAESTLAIGQDELKSAGFSAEMFRNLNTRKDLALARERDPQTARNDSSLRRPDNVRS